MGWVSTLRCGGLAIVLSATGSFALSLARSAGTPAEAAGPPPPSTSEVIAYLRKPQTGPDLANACRGVHAAVWGKGKEVQVQMARSGILEALVEVMAQHKADKEAFVECAEAVDGIVVFNADATEYLNTKTRAIEALMEGIKVHSKDAAAMQRLLPHVAGYTTVLSWKYGPRVKEAGGFDALFGALEHFRSKPFVQLAVWQGLSDHAHSPQGAALLADYGGHLAGCRRLVEELKSAAHHQPSPHLLTLKYEILQNINGLLQHDRERSHFDAFVQAGLPHALLDAMRIEEDRRVTVNVGLEVMLPLLKGMPAKDVPYEDFTRAAEAAMVKFAEPDLTPAWAGTITDAFPVLPAARAVQSALKSAKAKVGQ